MENIDYVVCKICGHRRRSIVSHLKYSHNLSSSEYETKFNSPVICEELRQKMHQQAMEWNIKMNSDPVMAEKLRKMRHDNALLPQVREAQSRYMKQYLSTEEGKAFNRNNMKIAQQSCGGTDEMQQRATEAKRNSEIFKHSHSVAMKNVIAKYVHNGEESGKAVRKKAFENARKHYTDCNGAEVRLRSLYELELYNYLITHDINFTYEEIWIQYEDDTGKLRDYIPDFYIPKHNLIIEVKPSQFTQSKSVLAQADAAKASNYNFVFVTEKELKDLNSFFHNVVHKFGS